MSDTSPRAMRAILDHLQLLSAAMHDMKVSMHVRFDEVGKRFDRLETRVDRLEVNVDRLVVTVDRLEDKVDCNHRALLEGAKERHERIARLEEVVCA